MIIILCSILTYIIPAGEYDVIESATGQKLVDPASFHLVESNPTTLYELFDAVPQGMVKMAALIFFVFVAGATFGVINETKTMEIGINKIAHALSGKEKLTLVLISAIFSVLGALMGFNSETVIFIPLGVALARKIGYDSITGISMVMVGSLVGFAAGACNPYTTVVAQEIVGLPTFSGLGFRIVEQIAIFIGTCWYMIHYAEKVKKDRTKSYCYELELALDKTEPAKLDEVVPFSVRNILVLITMGICFAILIYNSIVNSWGTAKMTPIFMAMGIISGVLGGLSGNQIAKAWIAGARSVAFGALAIGFGRGVLYVMENGMIFHTIIHALAEVLSVLPPVFVAISMFFSNVIINFFVPSGSGQATLVMPIMGPLAQILGVSQQTAIVAFQLGDGLTNIVIPTSSTTNACIGMANVGFVDWFKYAIRMFAVQAAIGTVFVAIAYFINL